MCKYIMCVYMPRYYSICSAWKSFAFCNFDSYFKSKFLCFRVKLQVLCAKIQSITYNHCLKKEEEMFYKFKLLYG